MAALLVIADVVTDALVVGAALVVVTALVVGAALVVVTALVVEGAALVAGGVVVVTLLAVVFCGAVLPLSWLAQDTAPRETKRVRLTGSKLRRVIGISLTVTDDVPFARFTRKGYAAPSSLDILLPGQKHER